MFVIHFDLNNNKSNIDALREITSADRELDQTEKTD